MQYIWNFPVLRIRFYLHTEYPGCQRDFFVAKLRLWVIEISLARISIAASSPLTIAASPRKKQHLWQPEYTRNSREAGNNEAAICGIFVVLIHHIKLENVPDNIDGMVIRWRQFWHHIMTLQRCKAKTPYNKTYGICICEHLVSFSNQCYCISTKQHWIAVTCFHQSYVSQLAYNCVQNVLF